MGRSRIRILVAVAVILVAIQFFGPSPSNPPEDSTQTLQANARVPADVDSLLERSCADCHTHRTEWPWYSRVAPVRWLLAHDVDEGRQHMNLSAWSTYNAYDQQHMLEELCEVVEEGEMPLAIYLSMHEAAELTEPERARLCEWARSERQRILAGMEGMSDGAKEGEEHEHEERDH